MADIVVTTGGDATVNGTNFASCIAVATFGDNIILQAGSTYFAAGGFRFGDKGVGSSYITVKSSNMAGLPGEGVRVDPATHASAMPKLVASGQPCISVDVEAHHWNFVGLDVTNDQNNYSAGLIAMANNGSSPGGYATWDELYATHDIIIDRCFVHNPEVTPADLHPEALEIWAGRGIAVAGVDITIKNSWIGSFAGYIGGTMTLTDSYGIYGGLGTNITIENNRIEAFFNNIFWVASAVNPAHTATVTSADLDSATFSSVTGITVGTIVAIEVPDGTDDCDGSVYPCWQSVEIESISGNDVTYSPYGAGGLSVTPVNMGIAQWDGGNPTNVITTRNHIWKNPWWQETWPGGAKDYIEVKTCWDCTYTANIFEGACAASIAFEVAQSGPNGGQPWDTIYNQLVENNLFLGDASAIFNSLVGSQATAGITVSNIPGRDIIFRNNLWQNITLDCGNNPSISGFFLTSGGTDVEFTHNTIRNVPNIVFGDTDSGQANVTFMDNIFQYGFSGFAYTGAGNYTNAWPPSGITEDGNIVVIDTETSNDPAGAGQVPNSFRVDSDDDVGFVNYAAADAGGINEIGGYALAGGSTYKGQATDNTDPGCDISALLTALGVNVGRTTKKGKVIRGRH